MPSWTFEPQADDARADGDYPSEREETKRANSKMFIEKLPRPTEWSYWNVGLEIPYAPSVT